MPSPFVTSDGVPISGGKCRRRKSSSKTPKTSRKKTSRKKTSRKKTSRKK